MTQDQINAIKESKEIINIINSELVLRGKNTQKYLNKAIEEFNLAQREEDTLFFCLSRSFDAIYGNKLNVSLSNNGFRYEPSEESSRKVSIILKSYLSSGRLTLNPSDLYISQPKDKNFIYF